MSTLALCNQHTIILLVIPIAISVMKTQQFTSTKRAINEAVKVAALGCIPYLYLPLMSCHGKSRYTWGEHCSISGILHHVLRSDFGTLQLAGGQQRFLAGRYMRDYIHTLSQNFGVSGVLTSLIGLVLLFHSQRLVYGHVLIMISGFILSRQKRSFLCIGLG